MAKRPPTEKKGNPTLERLAGLPFSSAAELKAEEKLVRLAAWRQLESARAYNELLQREEYAFWDEYFRAGIACRFAKEDGNLVRVFSEGKEIRVLINNDFAGDGKAPEKMLGALVRSLSETFTLTYFRARGMLPIDGAEVTTPAPPS